MLSFIVVDDFEEYRVGHYYYDVVLWMLLDACISTEVIVCIFMCVHIHMHVCVHTYSCVFIHMHACVCAWQVFEEALKTWLERQKMTEALSAAVSQHDVLSSVENNILLEFVDVAESLIRRSAVLGAAAVHYTVMSCHL